MPIQLNSTAAQLNKIAELYLEKTNRTLPMTALLENDMVTIDDKAFSIWDYDKIEEFLSNDIYNLAKSFVKAANQSYEQYRRNVNRNKGWVGYRQFIDNMEEFQLMEHADAFITQYFAKHFNVAASSIEIIEKELTAPIEENYHIDKYGLSRWSYKHTSHFSLYIVFLVNKQLLELYIPIRQSDKRAKIDEYHTLTIGFLLDALNRLPKSTLEFQRVKPQMIYKDVWNFELTATEWNYLEVYIGHTLTYIRPKRFTSFGRVVNKAYEDLKKRTQGRYNEDELTEQYHALLDNYKAKGLEVYQKINGPTTLR